ncbi:MAG: hypothetical protein M3209_17240 [Acidobacteriota bacterium]|nr:hypothetical protein [Acidobacteriota bacterium]
MRKIFQCAPYFRIVAFFVLFVFISFAETSEVGAFNNLSNEEPVAVAQTQIIGEWTAELGKTRPKKHEADEQEEVTKKDGLYVSLKRRTERGGMSNSGNTYDISDFQGLSREQITGSSNVNFSLQREAGTFQFQGSFSAGKGSGIFTLTPNQSFLSAMSSRGYTLSEEKQFASAMLDVRVKTVDDLKAAGFPNLSIDDVFKATIFKITPEFVSEMTSIGFKGLEMEDLVKARIFKIDAKFAREVKEMGFGENQPMETLVKMRIFKITPEFLREMRTSGLENLGIEDLVKLKIFKIDTAFIQRAQGASSAKLDVEDLVRMKIHGRVD